MVSIDTGWQPIETAPKDGTRVDLWANGMRLTDAKWRSISSFHEDDPETYAWYCPELDVYDGHEGWVDVPIDTTPIYWKPILPPLLESANHE